MAATTGGAHGEAILQLFNVGWEELTRKLPEIAEAGYTGLWLPPPAKAGSAYSVGYDLYDPFDLGDQDQQGTVATRYGTKTQLLELVTTAHRFGLRVYFDNVSNHRGFDTPGFDAQTPPEFYPGLRPQDFHLQIVGGGFYRNWPNVANWSNLSEVQNQPLFGLVDLANEPGGYNWNYGGTLGSTILKLSFIRHPGKNHLYMDTNLPSIGGGLHPFNGGDGDPVFEDVNAYLIRAAVWMINETKCDGFRLDAIKHVPSGFFGDTYDSPYGYCGAIQAMFDCVHGFGTGFSAYFETGGNRDSLFDTEAPRNDALLFGEHLGAPPSYQEYLERGMRLLNSPYRSHLNGVLGNPSASLTGLDQRDFRPEGNAFTGSQSVMFAQSHDDAYAVRRELQNAYYFTREGLAVIYSDGYNQSAAPPGEEPFPRVAGAPYLGQFGDNKMPDLVRLHHQLARGGTRARWSDADVVAYERYDYRDVELATPYTNPDATVMLFAMNDNYASAVSFDDGASQAATGTGCEGFPASGSRGQGLAVGFPPGSVLCQLADSPGGSQACGRLLVRHATASLVEAQSSINDPNPVNRKVYVGGQTILPGGGAVEFRIPAGSYVLYGYQWPEPSRANQYAEAITLVQHGRPAPVITVLRKDGANGDPGFNPLYPFKMRGGVGSDGSIIPGVNVSNLTYAIDIPVVTNAPFDIQARTDASASDVLLKLDGGIDVNSQMSLGLMAGSDRRDNRPGYASDVYLGYEQTAAQVRYGPEKFAAEDVARNNVTASGAEMWRYVVGGASEVVPGGGNGAGITNSTALWVFHQPSAPATLPAPLSSQRVPLDAVAGHDSEIYVKRNVRPPAVRCIVYYTIDGSNPNGAFGLGGGKTLVAEGTRAGGDATDPGAEWWRVAISGEHHYAGAEIRYKISFHSENIPPIPATDPAKYYGLAQFGVTNFDPAAAQVWLHNDLNSNYVATGLTSGFHIARVRAFLPRAGKSAVYNTFLQTFYYAGAAPTGVIAYPATDGATIPSSDFVVVVRAEANTTSVGYLIQDGNGTVAGDAVEVNPDTQLSRTHTNLPREFRFTYSPVPSTGTARLVIRLRDRASEVYPDRVGMLERTVNTSAPSASLALTAPETDGQILTLESNQVFTLQACYSSVLGTASSNFNIFINGALLPRNNYIFRPSGCGSGLRALYYNWTGAAPGTNLIQVVYTNGHQLVAGRTVAVARPGDSDCDGMSDAQELAAGTDPYDSTSLLRMISVQPRSSANQIEWESVPNLLYQVQAADNLESPMANLSGVVTGASISTFYLDTNSGSTGRYYRVRVVAP